jgi:hypothetical protein
VQRRKGDIICALCHPEFRENKMSKSLLLMITLLTGLLVLSCAKGPETNRNANAVAPTAPAPAGSVVTNRNTNSPGTTAATEKIGVEECDTYLTGVENCVAKVPQANRAQLEQAMKTSRTEWKKLADNPQTRGTLAGICKTALANARTAYKAYNCTF